MTFKELNAEWDEVLIIDLLSAEERKEPPISADLNKLINNRGFHSRLLNCSTNNDVIRILELALDLARTKSFMLHFTAHGNEQAIGNNLEINLSWGDLHPHLSKINDALNGELIINMMACKGIYGLKIDDLIAPNSPYYGLIGPTRDLSPDQASDITKMFYEKLFVEMKIPKAVDKINAKYNENILWAKSSQLRRNETILQKEV